MLTVAEVPEPPEKCFDASAGQGMPICTLEPGGTWEVTGYDDVGGLGGSGSGGAGGGFGVLVLLVLALGVATTVWKVNAARRMASRAGLDPADATMVTLADDPGLSAAYLASSLRTPTPAAAPAPPAAAATDEAAPARDAEARLRELTSLLERGLITQAEHDTRRRAVIDSI